MSRSGLHSRGVRAAAVVTLAVAGTLGTPAAAHDLPEASATIVVRDGGHVELRLQVPWAEVLRRRWMPGAQMEEFLAQATSRPPAEFARDLRAVRAELEAGTQVIVDGVTQPLPRWQWPAAADVQAALKRELMSRLALGADFEHASRLLVENSVVLGREPASVRLKLPALLGPALLTVYRPSEQWVVPGGLSAPVSVGRSGTQASPR